VAAYPPVPAGLGQRIEALKGFFVESRLFYPENRVTSGESTMSEQTLFELALKSPEADRAAVLDRECAGNPELRARVEARLAAQTANGSALDRPRGRPTDETRTFDTDPDVTAAHPGASESEGVVIAGKYKLFQRIGEGGMGSVWMADQTEPVKRRVAVKLIRVERGESKTILSRFEAERQAIALMDHPNIAHLLDAGTTATGSPFFVMELVRGVPLTEYCDEHKLGIPERLGLFIQICEAVQHAHQKGIIHRDLKPSNILVESHDGKPVPKVIDFGLAKATTGLQLSDHTLVTAFGSLMGTPLYMAPEQAGFNAVDVDTRADIYSLGVILYELLTGTTPLARDTVKKAPLDEMLKLIREHEAPTPSSRLSGANSPASVAANRHTEPLKLGRLLKGELDWIVLKALAKERDRRYQTANGLARDIERFLKHEPVQAGPPSASYRFKKFVRRNRPQVVAAAFILLALVAGFAGTTFGLIRANRSAEAERVAKVDAEEQKANAVASAEREAEERKRAETNAAEAVLQSNAVKAGFVKRQDSIDDLLIRIDRRLENVDGLESVRTEFLHEFLKLNEDLRKECADSPVVCRQAALLYQRIGDVESGARDITEGETAYREAIALFRKLAESAPKNHDHRVQLAYTLSQLAQLQTTGNRLTQAKESYAEAIRVREQLAGESPDPIHRARVASYRFGLANLLELLKQPKEAEAEYRRALVEQDRLAEAHPDQAFYREELNGTLTSLAVLLEDTRPDEALRFQERVARSARLAAKANYRANAPKAIDTNYALAEMLRKQGKHAELSKLAADVGKEFSDANELTYHAACFVARAVTAVSADKALEPAERERLATVYAKQAVDLIEKAFQLGWQERGHVFLDGDLDPLRKRPDFQNLLAELDKRVGKPMTPAQLVSYLEQRFMSEQAHVQQEIATAKTAAARKRAGSNLPKPSDFADRLLTLAEEHPKDPAAVTALSQVLAIAGQPVGLRAADAKRARGRALELLERDHFQSASFAVACEALARSPSPEGNQLLRKAAQNHSLRESRALAAFWLAQSLSSTSARRGTKPDVAEKLFKEAEQLYEKVIAEYASVEHGRTTLGEAAKLRLDEMRYLTVGRPALDIVGDDLEGHSMTLSDYRGKVVLLDFWANWCGFCRQMYPYEKALVARMKNEPFVMLGVNGDDNKEELRREIDRHGINWKSWWDGDARIRRHWQLEGYPLIFLIDHKGIIRYKFEGRTSGPVIDKALQELLREAKQSGPG